MRRLLAIGASVAALIWCGPTLANPPAPSVMGTSVIGTTTPYVVTASANCASANGGVGIAYFHDNASVTFTSITDSAGNTWVGDTGGGTGTNRGRMFTSKLTANIVNASTTWSVVTSANVGTPTLLFVCQPGTIGASDATGLSQTSGGATVSTFNFSTTSTTATARQFLGLFMSGSSTSGVFTGGWTSIGNALITQFGVQMFYQDLAPGVTPTFTATYSGSVSWTASWHSYDYTNTLNPQLLTLGVGQ